MYGLKPEDVDCKADEENEAPMKISEFPEFAEICCFINHFGEKLGVLLTFPRIARLLSCETDDDLQSLTTLVVKLLNKMRLRTQLNRWQPALGRFLQRHAYNCDELRSIGDGLNNGSPPTLFFSLPPQRRLRVLLFCLETQFHLNVPFKEKVKTIDSHILRTPPLGVDIFGNSYWLLVDTECNFLLYRSSAEDMTLELLSDSFSTLETVIDDLKDEKYKQTPISELYSIFRASAKQEPTELINFPSPPTLPDIVAPREVKLDEPDVHVKPEAVKLPERKSEESEGEQKEDTVAESCVEAPTEPAKEKPDSGVIASEGTVHQAELQQQETELSSSVKDEKPQETLGLRRSGRKRKQVEFLAMESFNKGTKSRGKKSISMSASKKVRQTEGRLKEDKSRKEKGSKKRRKRRRGKKPRNGHNGSSGCLWTRSPEDSETDNEEDEDDDMWNDAGSNDPDDSNSSLQDGEKQSLRDWLEELESDFDLDAEDEGDSGVVAGRNLQRQKAQVLDEAPCHICTKSNNPEWLLLCDSCDLGFHAQCLRPALHLIPEGDWFCPRCLHSRLVTALVEQLSTLQARSKKLDSAARMQERLNFVNISVTNILRDERTRRPVVDSDSTSVESEESSHRARRRRSRYYESSGSTSDDVSSSEEEGDDDDDEGGEDVEDGEEEEDELPARTTRHRNVHYNVNAAFQQLDEVLVEDEKYAQERLERSKAKNQHSDPEGGGKDENAACGGPPMPGSVVLKTAKRKRLSSSSASSASEGRERGKRRRRVSPGSEEFRPSDESENDEDEDEEYEDEVEVNSSTAESVSSDQSWKVGRRRRSRRHRRAARRSRYRRGGRPSKGGRGRRIPHFEGPSSDEDGEDSVPLRRSSRVRVNYREIESSEEEENERGGKATALEKNPSRRRANAASSGSEYAPSEEAEAAEEDEEDVEREEEEGRGIGGIQSSSLAVKLPPILSTDVEGEISQISNPMATSRELGDANTPHIDEDSMDMVKDDPIFQNFVIDELVLPIQEAENASHMQHGSPSL